jgi:hypothetical protein
MSIVLRVIVTLLAAAIAAPTAAQVDCKIIETKLAGDPLKMLGFLTSGHCLGEDKDSAPVTKAVLDRLAKPDGVDAALQQVSEYVRDALRQRKPESQGALAALALEIEAARNRYRAQQPLGELNTEAWVWVKDRFRGLPTVHTESWRITCSPQAMDPCTEVGEAGKVALRAASLTRQAIQTSQKDVYEQALAAARLRKAKWDAYFDDSRVQFPWEVFANSYFHKWLGRSKGGFADVPNDQLILFHPGVGMEYVKDAPAGSRFEGALVVEIIGYNFWGWTKEGKIDHALGASIIQTYSDRAGLSSMRPGLMVHYNNRYSIAFTRKNGETGVLLSVDLAKLVTKVEADTRENFKLGDRLTAGAETR